MGVKAYRRRTKTLQERGKAGCGEVMAPKSTI
jgi:hypothetical protein